MVSIKGDIPEATKNSKGFMSAEDKIKLDEMTIQIVDENTEINDDGIYLIDKPVFMKALTTFHNSSQYFVGISFPTDNTTNLIIDWGDGTQDEGIAKSYQHTYNDNTKKYNVVVKGDIKSLTAPMCQGDFSEIELKQNITCPGEFASGSSFTKIILPKNISAIPNGFCYNQSQLENIIIPNSVTTLGTSCFQGCTGLTSIIIPNSVTTLGTSCFQGCTGLTSIIIPDSVVTLGENCFTNCTGLTSIIIPDSVTTLGSGCFQGCTGLTSITIPNSVTTITTPSLVSNCSNLSLIKVYWTSISGQIGFMLRDMQRASKLQQNLTWEIPFGTTELYSSYLNSSQLVEREE